ncbi:MAG TPA: mannonate dehydratase, partial [Bacteroidota bacterium]|nr:mannonate dehydratase [Bacteroidota bacterium]
TWRWFGPADPVTLAEIRQTGATGIVTALHQIQPGEAWTRRDILERRGEIERARLTWSVAESLPVSESIKTRSGMYRKHMDNYAASLRALGECGVDTVCYNFMPVLDWSRTDLGTIAPDGSVTTRFEAVPFAAFDICMLGRRGAEKDYTGATAAAARAWYDRADGAARERLLRTVLLGLPGSGSTMTLGEFREALGRYADVGDAGLRANLNEFLREMTPVAEEAGVRLAIHPDDPPWPLLGLPRIVSTASDVEAILAAADSPSNGITLCTGSFGASPRNNCAAMAERFASRLNFVHLRNVHADGDGGFAEDDHLTGDVDMFGVVRAILREQSRREREGRADRRMPMRPDHGRTTLADEMLAGVRGKNTYPGYSLVGRMRALAELRGLEHGIRLSLGL